MIHFLIIYTGCMMVCWYRYFPFYKILQQMTSDIGHYFTVGELSSTILN